MDKQEAVQKLATVGRLSMSYAEDLYDSFFPKPVVPQFVADWYEENKKDFELNLFQCIYEALDEYTTDSSNEFWHWLMSKDTEVIQTLVNVHQFGYEVEEEPRYTVKFNNFRANASYLKKDLTDQEYYTGGTHTNKHIIVAHTRKELEDADFGWVFDCPGVEVKEVE